MVERLHLERLVAKRALHALAPTRCNGDHFVGREVTLGQNAEHLVPDIACGTYDCDLVTHC